jgi:hypothetical protein
MQTADEDMLKKKKALLYFRTQTSSTFDRK